MAGETEASIVSKEDLEAASEQAFDGLLKAAEQTIGGDFTVLVGIAKNQILPALAGLLVLVVGYFVAKYAARACSAPIRSRVDETLGKFVGKLIFYSIMMSTVVGVISKLGYDVTSVSAIMAAAGFAVGLAFQGTLSNFASGVLLLVFRPFKVGDMVVVAGMHGRVFEIDLFSTSIDTSDNRRIILPNSSIAGNTIENMTHHTHRRIEVAVGVAYDADMMATRSALTEAAQSLGDLIITGADRSCKVTLNQLGPHSVDWSIQAWVNTTDVGLAKEILTVAIKESLDAASIGIPFPQLQIHAGPLFSSNTDARSEGSNTIAARPPLANPGRAA